MAIKSWAFEQDGHFIRAEIGWRWWGRTRKRLYVDHNFCAGSRGRWNFHHLLIGKFPNANGGMDAIDVRFKPTWFLRDMTCLVNIAEKPALLDEKPVQIEKSSDSSWHTNDKSISAIGCLILFFALAAAMILTVPVWIVAYLLFMPINKLKLWRDRRKGRRVDWPGIVERMQQAPGTLIVRFDLVRDSEFWWTPDNLLEKSPLPIVPAKAHLKHASVRSPFAAWCEAGYLSKVPAAVVRTLPPPGLINFDAMVEGTPDDNLGPDYPGTLVVTIERSAVKPAAATAFFDLVGFEGGNLIPRLISGIDSPDAGVRRLCLSTLSLKGIADARAIPILTRHLYFGPWDERNDAAQALVACGGLDAVRAASETQDPRIADPAKLAIRRFDRANKDAALDDDATSDDVPRHPDSTTEQLPTEPAP